MRFVSLMTKLQVEMALLSGNAAGIMFMGIGATTACPNLYIKDNFVLIRMHRSIKVFSLFGVIANFTVLGELDICLNLRQVEEDGPFFTATLISSVMLEIRESLITKVLTWSAILKYNYALYINFRT